MRKLITLLCILTFVSLSSQKLHRGFVILSDFDNTIQSELRYLGNNNFIGKPIDGYQRNCIIVTQETAIALKKIQQILLKKGLSLKVFDAYRPQQAVDHFVRWAKQINDTLMKKEYYPDVPKSELFTQGYIATKSGHSRGSTVDVTLIHTSTNKELEMGSHYDFFGEKSHPFSKNINKHQRENRLYLRKIMLANGFKPYENEWWHFTLKKEPFPNTYFNFPIQ
jgi:D-alanyl-D-alanine dipeptidase